MDYKELYLKYKTKYLNAKEEIKKKNIFKGGSINIEEQIDKILQNNKLSNDDFKNCLNSHLQSKPYTNKNITTKPENNLLVIVYAHWCGHCTSFIKEEGAKLVSNEFSPNIIFVDGTKLDNELNNILEVRGFPTIVKINKDSSPNNIIKKEYMGLRTSDDLKIFINI